MDFAQAFGKLNIASYVFLILFGLASIIQMIFAISEKENYRRIEKPFCLLFLGMFALVSFPSHPLIYAGAFLGMVGDILVLFKDNRIFALGALSFFLGHLCYAIEIINVFLKSNIPYQNIIIICGCFVIFFIGIFVLANRFIEKKWERVGASIYYASLFTMLPLIITCYFLVGSFSYLLVIGIVFFIISDIIILFTKYVRKFKKYDVAIMGTYLIAQLFLITGLTTMVAVL